MGIRARCTAATDSAPQRPGSASACGGKTRSRETGDARSRQSGSGWPCGSRLLVPDGPPRASLREVLAEPAQLAADDLVLVPPSAHHLCAEVAEPVSGERGWSSLPFVLDLPGLLVQPMRAPQAEVHLGMVAEVHGRSDAPVLRYLWPYGNHWASSTSWRGLERRMQAPRVC